MPNASINAPKAMVLAVAIGTVSSFIFLVVVRFCLNELSLVFLTHASYSFLGVALVLSHRRQCS